MARVDGGELLVRVLAGAGIREFFTLHGGHLDAILQAARRHDFRLIDTRHEQAAAHAADGWARTTGRVGVAVVTAGPGVTDAVTGVANAWLDCIPMLLIGGAAPLRDAETLPLQGGFDQVALFTPITKWAHRVTHTARIPDLVSQALRLAVTGRPGPVYLEIPIDVLFARVDEERVEVPRTTAPRALPRPSDASVEEVIELLAAAERPAILAGGGAWFSRAGEELRAFAERVRAPVFSNGKAHGLVPADHPLCGRGFGTLAVVRAMGGEAADVVLLFGARIGMFTGGRSGAVIPHTAKVVQIDIEGEEIGRNRDIEVGIVADCRESLRALGEAAAGRQWPEREKWLESVRRARSGHEALFASALERTRPPVHPYQLARAIVDAVDGDAILVADGGETAGWMEMVAEVGGGGRWLSHGYLGCLGTGMPFAIAAKVAHPDRQVVCVVGDGSVGLNFAEFDTMARHSLDITVVIFNDHQWGMSAHGQDLIYGDDRRVVTDLAPTRYDLAAAGFGCRAECVVEPSELGPALSRALGGAGPCCVNVMVDPAVIAPVTYAVMGSVGGGSGSGSGETGGDERVRLPYYDDL